ncbi:TdeIII family type II restriction endonuclease [Methanoculleus frigidifontis]|uniref:TdeIII family type II restriction endonuclease n=1 Tax=Methanoculleus frigidifontis TaxID=2584085 RepID=UPI00265A46B5|nr:TdeIII family type II restriction endonuclease [Methanoculleus sp. FWC-SCC1]
MYVHLHLCTYTPVIILPEFLRINEFERGFSTSLGNSFEGCARLIALQHHAKAERGHVLTGYVSRAAMDEIEHQIAAFESAAEQKGKKPALTR